jgi:GNAT superfamily N-acetyltransferase
MVIAKACLLLQPSHMYPSYCRHNRRRECFTMATIRHATFPDDTALVLGIWREFIANSPVNLDYQQNDGEFANLPGKYATPKGCVLLVDSGSEIHGCVAMRQVSADICEMKRLYIRPHARGKGLGLKLVERLIEEARGAGYREMRLDVQQKSVAARNLYEALGFLPAEPISFNPVPGASFLGRQL